MTPEAVDVALEDAAVGVERDDALLDPGPGAVVEPDHGHAGRGGQVHHLVDLLGEDLAERAAEDGEVLAEDADPAAVDRAEARSRRRRCRGGCPRGPCRGPGGGPACRAPGTTPRRAGSRCAPGRSACPWRVGARRPAALPACRASFLRSARSARRSAMECSMRLRLTLPGTARNCDRKSPDWNPFSFRREKPGLTRKKKMRPGAQPAREPARPHWGETNAASASGGSRGSIRRRARAARRGPDGRRRQRHRTHRPQRRRQDDVLQRHLRAADRSTRAGSPSTAPT